MNTAEQRIDDLKRVQQNILKLRGEDQKIGKYRKECKTQMGHVVKSPEERKEHGTEAIFEEKSRELSEIDKWQQTTRRSSVNIKQNEFKEGHT